MKIYQLDSELKRHDIMIFTKDLENVEDLVKRIAKNKWKLMYDRLLDNYSVYVENIPKKICKYKEITIVIDDSGIRYFSGLC